MKYGELSIISFSVWTKFVTAIFTTNLLPLYIKKKGTKHFKNPFLEKRNQITINPVYIKWLKIIQKLS